MMKVFIDRAQGVVAQLNSAFFRFGARPTQAIRALLGAQRAKLAFKQRFVRLFLAVALASCLDASPGQAMDLPPRLSPAWQKLSAPTAPQQDDCLQWGGAQRGMTLGPIEGELQKERGYGSAEFEQTLDQLQREGVNWISLTTFAKVWDTDSTGLTLDFEQPRAEIEERIVRSVQMAHARGMRVLLVPHLWVETGRWRAEMNPGSDAEWQRWVENYRKYLLASAQLAERAEIDLLAIGVELRSWLTTTRAASMIPLIAAAREIYSGPLTYAANWDDAVDTVIWNELDLIGINAFYPLHWENGASQEQLIAGGQRVKAEIELLSRRFDRPVFFSEFGYTNRDDPAIQPWLWPEELGSVQLNEAAQAEAYAALLSQLPEAKGFCGFFVWRMYADIADMSQEAAWGFSPWGRPAFDVLRAAYSAEAWADGLSYSSATSNDN